MNTRTFLSLFSIIVAGASPAPGFVFLENLPAWPTGTTVTLELQLGGSPVYSDGTTPNQTAIQAIAAWNPSMSRVQLGYVNNSGAAKTNNNGKNNVFFSNRVFGTNFGDGVLAVTVGRSSASGPTELDVVVNNAETWDSYRGALRSATDLRRVLAHELGHVLGLDHPDDHGQWVNALMNAYVSDIDTTQQDDRDGVSARYGRGPGNPASPPVFNYQPYSSSAIEGQQVEFYAIAQGSEPMTYQWHKDDAPLAGATDPRLTIPFVRVADSGRYFLTATNDGGSASSSVATLTVTAAQPPVFNTHPQSATVEAGSSFSLNAWAYSNASVTYQWLHNGAEIPGATTSSLYLVDVTATDAGDYRVVASTASGTATSNIATVTVVPARPPVVSTHPTGGSVIIGSDFSFYGYVTSATPLTYQWLHDDVAIPGATSNSLSISSAKASDAGAYRLTASNAAGAVSTQSATLVIEPLPPPARLDVSNANLIAGATLSLAPWGTGSGNITYQWYKDGTAIPGATYSGYYVSVATPADAGDYFVVITNPSGSTTSTTSHVTVSGGSTVALGGWKQVVTVGEVVYFLFENPARIERFSLTSESWLSTIALPRAPTVMAVGSDASPSAYVFFSRTLSRIDLSTTQETPLATVDSDIIDLALLGDRLYALSTDPTYYSHRRIGSLNVVAPTVFTWSGGSYDLGRGLSIDATHRKAYNLSDMISPTDIASVELKTDGTFGAIQNSPYHGAYPTGTRTFVAPDDAHVYDSSGIIYSTTGLTYTGSVGGAFDSIAFLPDGSPTILRGKTITGFDATLSEIGTVSLTGIAQHIAVSEGSIYAFRQPSGSGSSIVWEKRALSALARPASLPAVSASDLAYSADDILQDRDGTLLILSRIHGNIFRWSTSEQRYLAPVPLKGFPNHVTYSAELHRIYLGYADNHIRCIDLDDGIEETLFTTAPQSIQGLCAAGEHLMLCDPSGAWYGYFSYDAAGRLINSSDWRNLSRTFVWNAAKRRVYHFRDDLSPNDLLYTEISPSGVIGLTKNSPFHGAISTEPPIRISPSGDNILLGSGRFFNADTLDQNNALANSIRDAAWLGSTVYSARDTLAGAEIQRWGGSNYGLDASRILAGRIVRLFADAGRLIAVTQKSGRLAFTLLGADLSIKNHFEDSPDLARARLTNLSTRADVGTGDNIMIAGFVVNGSQPKRLLVRAIGPGLLQFGVNDALADPVLHLVRLDGTPVSSSDDWGSTDPEGLRAAFALTGAFTLDPGSRDAALIVELSPGPYTAKVSGKDTTTGVALVEAYDLDADAGERRLVNISTRAMVGTGAKVLIPGLVVDGAVPKRLLIRAVGPTLGSFGVGGTLADPQLKVLNAQREVLFSNDNWESDNAEVTIASTAAAGGFALNAGSRDAALVATLPPGIYTVAVSGVNNSTGVALVEVYEVP